MDCPKCFGAMVETQISPRHGSYYYCRACKKELCELATTIVSPKNNKNMTLEEVIALMKSVNTKFPHTFIMHRFTGVNPATKFNIGPSGKQCNEAVCVTYEPRIGDYEAQFVWEDGIVIKDLQGWAK